MTVPYGTLLRLGTIQARVAELADTFDALDHQLDQTITDLSGTRNHPDGLYLCHFWEEFNRDVERRRSDG
jgi:hypothetical protein